VNQEYYIPGNVDHIGKYEVTNYWQNMRQSVRKKCTCF